jgi:quercetin dioxygenase-like cupin family protein
MTQEIVQQITVSIYPESYSPERFYAELDKAAEMYSNQPEKLIETFQTLLFQANIPALRAHARKGKTPQNYRVSHLYCSKNVSVVAVKMATNGEIIPHNHPGMVGLMYLMQGKVQVRIYRPPTEEPTRYLEVEKEVTLKEGSIGSLAPQRGNYHSLKAQNEVIFLDIFSPNYNLKQLPSYYRVLEDLGNGIIAVEPAKTKAKMVRRILRHKALYLFSRLKAGLLALLRK